MPAPITTPFSPTQFQGWASFFGGNVQAPPPPVWSTWGPQGLGNQPPKTPAGYTGGWAYPDAWANFYGNKQGFQGQQFGNASGALAAQNYGRNVNNPNDPNLLGWEQVYGNPQTILQRDQDWSKSLGKAPLTGPISGGWQNPAAWAAYYGGTNGFTAPANAGSPASALAAAAQIAKTSNPQNNPALLGWVQDYGQPGSVLANTPNWAASLGMPNVNNMGQDIGQTNTQSWESPLAWAAYYGGFQGYKQAVDNNLQAARNWAGVTNQNDPSLLGWELDYGNPQTVVSKIEASKPYQDYLAQVAAQKAAQAKALADYQAALQQYQQQLAAQQAAQAAQLAAQQAAAQQQQQAPRQRRIGSPRWIARHTPAGFEPAPADLQAMGIVAIGYRNGVPIGWGPVSNWTQAVITHPTDEFGANVPHIMVFNGNATYSGPSTQGFTGGAGGGGVSPTQPILNSSLTGVPFGLPGVGFTVPQPNYTFATANYGALGNYTGYVQGAFAPTGLNPILGPGNPNFITPIGYSSGISPSTPFYGPAAWTYTIPFGGIGSPVETPLIPTFEPSASTFFGTPFENLNAGNLLGAQEGLIPELSSPGFQDVPGIMPDMGIDFNPFVDDFGRPIPEITPPAPFDVGGALQSISNYLTGIVAGWLPSPSQPSAPEQFASPELPEISFPTIPTAPGIAVTTPIEGFNPSGGTGGIQGPEISQIGADLGTFAQQLTQPLPLWLQSGLQGNVEPSSIAGFPNTAPLTPFDLNAEPIPFPETFADTFGADVGGMPYTPPNVYVDPNLSFGADSLYQGGYGQPAQEQLPPPAVQSASESFVERYGPSTTLRQVLTDSAVGGMLNGYALDKVFWALGKGVDTPIDLTDPNFLSQIKTAIDEGGGWASDQVVSGLQQALASHGQSPQAIASAASDIAQDIQEGPGAYGQLPLTTIPIYGEQQPIPRAAETPNYNPTGIRPPAEIPGPSTEGQPFTPPDYGTISYNLGQGYGGGSTNQGQLATVLTAAQATSGAPTAILQQAAALVASGKNTQELQAWMASQGFPQWFNWCAEFVSSVQSAMGNPIPSGEMGSPRIAASYLNWGQPTDNPQAGDVFVKGGTGEQGIGGHAGMISEVGSDGKLTLIQGNPAREYTSTIQALQQQGYQFRSAPSEVSPEFGGQFVTNAPEPQPYSTPNYGELSPLQFTSPDYGGFPFSPPNFGTLPFTPPDYGGLPLDTQAGYNYPPGSFGGIPYPDLLPPGENVQTGYSFPQGAYGGGLEEQPPPSVGYPAPEPTFSNLFQEPTPPVDDFGRLIPEITPSPLGEGGQILQPPDMMSVAPETPGMWSETDQARLDATNNTIENTVLSRGLNWMLSQWQPLEQQAADALRSWLAPAPDYTGAPYMGFDLGASSFGADPFAAAYGNQPSPEMQAGYNYPSGSFSQPGITQFGLPVSEEETQGFPITQQTFPMAPGEAPIEILPGMGGSSPYVSPEGIPVTPQDITASDWPTAAAITAMNDPNIGTPQQANIPQSIREQFYGGYYAPLADMLADNPAALNQLMGMAATETRPNINSIAYWNPETGESTAFNATPEQGYQELLSSFLGRYLAGVSDPIALMNNPQALINFATRGPASWAQQMLQGWPDTRGVGYWGGNAKTMGQLEPGQADIIQAGLDALLSRGPIAPTQTVGNWSANDSFKYLSQTLGMQRSPGVTNLETISPQGNALLPSRFNENLATEDVAATRAYVNRINDIIRGMGYAP